MEEEKYPRFLSSKPLGEDKFEGKPQERVANAIVELIKENSIAKKVIGLEGEWGSGKSNVIEIVKNKLDTEKYFTFVFDAWGNQEDLTRRTFLEEIINQLFDKELLKDEKKWEEKKKLLLAKKSTINKTFFPKVKPYWILFSLSFFSHLILSSLFENIFVKIDILPFFTASIIIKEIFFVYLIPSIFFIWGLIRSTKDFSKEREEIQKKGKDESRLKTLSKVFYWIKGDQIESEETENIIEEEPTVRQFREYFEEIENDIEDLGLLIVFDNIDRLETEKIRALWSSIHTFFAEEPKIKEWKTWVIIPYFKEKLTQLFDEKDNQQRDRDKGQGFLEKTFSINFQVPPPVVSDWEKFLDVKINEAFGDNLSSNIEKDFIKSIFDRFYYKSKTIKPREIINYVNNLVSMYKQWETEILDNKIKFRYVALFVLTKDEILKDPINNIILQNYLSGCEGLFTDDDKLDISISSLVFNVDKSKAEEILLKRSLKAAIRDGDLELIESAKEYTAFKKYFKDAFEELDYHEKKKNLREVIGKVSDTLSTNTIKSYWNLFCDYNDEEELDNFTKDHRMILLNVKPKRQKRLLKKIIERLSRNKTDDEIKEHYYQQICLMEDFFQEKNIQIDIYSLLPEMVFPPRLFLRMIDDQGESYPKLKIKCADNSLLEYLAPKAEPNLNRLEKHGYELGLIKDEYDLESIKNKLTKNITGYNINNQDLLGKSINALKTVSKDDVLDVSLNPNFYNQIQNSAIDRKLILEAIAIGISDFENAIKQGDFQNSLNNLNEDDIKAISEIIEQYITYGDFLNCFYEKPSFKKYSSLGKIAVILNEGKSSKSRLNLSSCLQNYSKITSSVFDNDESKIVSFLKNINRWHSNYKNDFFHKIDQYFFKHLSIQNLILVKKIRDDAIKLSKKLSEQEVLQALKTDDRNGAILYHLLKNDLIKKLDVNYKRAFEQYLDLVLKEEIPKPQENTFARVITKGLDGRNLIGIYNQIRKKILLSPEVRSVPVINYFTPYLIRYGKLENMSRKELISLSQHLFKENPNNIHLLINHSDFFIKIVKKANIPSSEICKKLGLSIEKINNSDLKKKLIEELGLSS